MRELQESIVRSQAILMINRNPRKLTYGNAYIIDL